MASLVSFSSFDLFAVNLYWYSANAFDSALEDNANVLVNGRTYQDYFWVNGYDGFDDLELDFLGSNITVNSLGDITGGTVNFIAEFDLNADELLWYAEAISVSAVAIYNAALTSSNLDEINLIQTALSGNDLISLSPYNDRMNGFAGDDTITGGPGSDTLSGGSGNDTFIDTASGLNGDVITDFAIGDRIIISDANSASFSYSLNGSTLTFTGGSLTLGSAIPGTLVATAAAGGGVQLQIGSSTPPQDVRNDFNGDGRSDILWRSDSGAFASWLGQTNGSFANNAPGSGQVPTNWHVSGTGDFNGDGRDDILWRNDTGAFVSWLGQANGSFANNASGSGQVPTDWHVNGTGDFNGDGRDDILWRNDAGAFASWLGQANGSFANNASGSGQVPTDWQVNGTGDFSGDGRDDILWRNDAGAFVSWLGQASGSFANNSAGSGQVPTDWHVSGTGDFNGDGRDDILWRSDAGAFVSWLGQANGSFANNPNGSGQVPGNWVVAGTGDFNGDGRDDILWHSRSGDFVSWLGQASGSFANNPNGSGHVGFDWHVQGHPAALGFWYY